MTETPDLTKLKDDELMRLFWATKDDAVAFACSDEMRRRGFDAYGGLRVH